MSTYERVYCISKRVWIIGFEVLLVNKRVIEQRGNIMYTLSNSGIRQSAFELSFVKPKPLIMYCNYNFKSK